MTMTYRKIKVKNPTTQEIEDFVFGNDTEINDDSQTDSNTWSANKIKQEITTEVTKEKDILSNRIDNIVVNASGTSNIEVTDARVDANGKNYASLKARLDGDSTTQKDTLSALDSRLSESITEISNEVFDTKKLDADKTTSGWAIVEGGCVVNNKGNYTIQKFVVVGGEKLYIKATDYWQFQNAESIPTWGNISIVGDTRFGNDGYVIVPNGATWLMISTPPNDVDSGLYSFNSSKIQNNTDAIEQIKADIYGSEVVDVDLKAKMTNTCFTNNGGTGSTISETGVSEAQFKCIVIPCKNGDKFKITGTGGSAYRLWCFTDNSRKILSVANAWATATEQTVTANADGFFYFQISTAYNYAISQLDVLIESIKVEKKVEYLTLLTGFGMFQSIAGIGDSYTEGDMVKQDGTWITKTGINYLSTIGKRNGVTVKNYGSGGATSKTYQERPAFTQYALVESPSDLYIFALGQNDVNMATTKGTVADIHDEDYTQNADTFCGNYGKVIQQIKNHAPNAKFVIVGSWVKGNASNGLPYQSYNDAIKAIADHYGIPYIDPFDDPFFESDLYNNNMSSGHPVAMGYIGMGIAMERLFSKCVNENQAYFKYALLD